MAGWSKITDLRLVPEFDKAHIPPDGRCVLAVDVYFKAIDENNNQMDALSFGELNNAITLMEGRDGKEKINYVHSVKEIPSDASYWFYTASPDGAVRAGSNAGAGQDDVYDIDGIEWGNGKGHDTGKKPPKGNGGNETPAPTHSDKDYQHIRYYVGCGYKAERALTLGISIKPPQSKDAYLSWTGGSGEHHFSVTLDLMAAGPAFDQDVQPGTYYIIPDNAATQCIHPRGGKNILDGWPIVTYPEFTDWSKWEFIRDKKDSNLFLIRSAYNPEMYLRQTSWSGPSPSTWQQVATRALPSESDDAEYKRFQFKVEYTDHDMTNGNKYRISSTDDCTLYTVASEFHGMEQQAIGCTYLGHPESNYQSGRLEDFFISDKPPQSELPIGAKRWYLMNLKH